jgi:hypothetical protein
MMPQGMRFRDPSTPLTLAQIRVRKLVYEQISELPSTLDMGDWEFQYDDLEERGCYTTRCIGGWAQFFYRGYVDINCVEADAVGAMGLTWDEYYHAPTMTRLFYCTDEQATDRMRQLAMVS